LISPLFTGNRPPQSPRQWHRNCLRVGVGPPHGRADRLCQSRNTSSGSIDVRAIRLSTTGGIAVTQKGFADAIGVPVKTLRNWEQGRRQPTGPARVLLARCGSSRAALRVTALTRVAHRSVGRRGRQSRRAPCRARRLCDGGCRLLSLWRSSGEILNHGCKSLRSDFHRAGERMIDCHNGQQPGKN
jgi:Helix-turn-helix